MEDMQAQMGAILNNPEMMQKIMAMAQSLGGSTPQEEPREPPPAKGPELPNIDLGMLQRLSGLAGQSNIDKDQKTLLHALGPYLKHDRIQKLEKAMRAAKMARLASSIIGQPGLFGGR